MGREVVAGEAVRRGIWDSKHARLILYAKEIGGGRSPARSPLWRPSPAGRERNGSGAQAPDEREKEHGTPLRMRRQMNYAGRWGGAV